MQVEDEGCLSVPGFNASVVRPAGGCSGLDREGNERTIEGTGRLARAFQHEIDHLDGTLFVDRLRGIKRDLIVRRIQKLEALREMVTPQPPDGKEALPLRVVYFGTPLVRRSRPRSSAQLTARRGCCRHPTGSPARRGHHVTAGPVKALAESHGLPVLQPEKIKAPALLDSLRACAPDLVCCGGGWPDTA